MIYQIAIDGPSGAGKSTVAKLLAKELKISYLDTGAMYRCLALKAINSGIDFNDDGGINWLLNNTRIDFAAKEGKNLTLLDGKDVTDLIRTEQVSKAASDISAFPAVRKNMATLQREIAMRKSCVLDGRDIGSYVLPNAKYKFFLTASAETRAKRRYDEYLAKGQKADYQKLLSDIIQRDYNDSHREFAPLIQAEDAIYIDSDNLSAEQVLSKMLDIIRDKGE